MRDDSDNGYTTSSGESLGYISSGGYQGNTGEREHQDADESGYQSGVGEAGYQTSGEYQTGTGAA